MSARVGTDVGAVALRRKSDRGEGTMVAENVILGDRQLKVNDVQELAFNAANVTLAKHTSAKRPVDVFECGIVEILGVRDGKARSTC